ncbi:hypothetical protein QUB67_19675 [Microcoleus sp. ARI1-A1]|uniref:hypothetical protein n=1 Tax=unclassified Microcoleus TaxID=2642155 RepID=UPI002FD05153
MPFAKAQDFTGDRAKLLVARRCDAPVFSTRSVLADRGGTSGSGAICAVEGAWYTKPETFTTFA